VGATGARTDARRRGCSGIRASARRAPP
jgi:hypothetical protein